MEEFDFACESRCEVPRSRLLTISQMSEDELEEEIRLLSEQINLISSILADRPEGAEETARKRFNEIPVSSFSKDHGWRDIVQSLRKTEKGRLVAQCQISLLRHYRSYLLNRCDKLKEILSSSPRMEDDSSPEQESPPESPHYGKMMEAKQVAGYEYERLPRGQSITLTIQPGEDMDILLSRHKCKFIIEDRDLKFMSNDNREPVVIRPGRTAVGRDTVNDIVLDAAWRDVSRLHLVIDRRGDQLHITDMSSYGTFLPTHLIARHKDTLH